MAEVSFVVFADLEARRTELASRLGGNPHVEVLEVTGEASELSSVVAEHTPEALLVDLGERPAEVLETLQKLPSPRPAMILTGPQTDHRVLLAAMRLGVREFLPRDFDPRALDAVVESLAGENATTPGTEPATTVAVMGAKGGVGATFLACQLAAAFQRAHHPAALVDLSLPVGDAAVHLDLQPGFTLADVATEGERVDATSLRAILQAHGSGIQLLAAPDSIEAAQRIEARHVDHALQLLRGEFARIVLDVPRVWNDVATLALDRADLILLVTTREVPVLYQARQHIALLRRLGFESKLRLVANGCYRGQPVSDDDYTSFLERVPDVALPDDEAAEASVNQGKLLWDVARRCPLARGIDELAATADTWCGVETKREEHAGWWNKLLGRKSNGTH